ncbi:MAG: N-acetylneuraminate synthase family protein, partial [Candidatus Omnitrophota bacterium]
RIIFLITPFDEVSLEELDDLDLAAYKIASTDTTNLPFLVRVARKGKPIILSTGMTYLREVKSALKTIHPINREVVVLQCTANYPAVDNEVNLRVLETYQKRFDALLGYSDHTVGIGASPFAVSLGAKVIEKHFTLNKKQKGPDHKASLGPKELHDFVREIRRVEEILGSGVKAPTLSEQKTRLSLQKCLVAVRTIEAGEIFNEHNVAAKRTGGVGISPVYYKKVFGKKSNRKYQKDEIIDA